VSYPDYGGRGITVCQRWHSFFNFWADVKERPSSRHSLERLDNNKGYSPDNVIWALPIVQAQNKRTPKHNTSGVQGVHFDTYKQKWVAEKVRYRKRTRQVCESFEEACRIIAEM
jgi:hypothetical protein